MKIMKFKQILIILFYNHGNHIFITDNSLTQLLELVDIRYRFKEYWRNTSFLSNQFDKNYDLSFSWYQLHSLKNASLFWRSFPYMIKKMMKNRILINDRLERAYQINFIKMKISHFLDESFIFWKVLYYFDAVFPLRSKRIMKNTILIIINDRLEWA